jgi:hypothetical protein
MQSDAEFTPEELELMKELDESEGVTPDDAAGADQAQKTTEQEAPAASEATEQTQASSEAQPADKEASTGGDLSVALKKDRNALRAARHDARQAQQEVERLRKELEEARKAIPASRTEEDEVLAVLEEDLPQVAVIVKALKAEVQELKAANTPQKAAQPPAFVADTLPDDLQEAVDQIDELADWQHNQDQTLWNAAKRADELLFGLPAWRDKPLPERMAEVVRIVKQQASASTPAAAPARDPKQAARDAINNAPRQPLAIGDLRGGAAPRASGPNYGAMTDEEIIASL